MTEKRGLAFTHDPGAIGEFFMPEMIGSGVAIFDYDNDGRLDPEFLQNAGAASPSLDLVTTNLASEAHLPQHRAEPQPLADGARANRHSADAMRTGRRSRSSPPDGALRIGSCPASATSAAAIRARTLASAPARERFPGAGTDRIVTLCHGEGEGISQG